MTKQELLNRLNIDEQSANELIAAALDNPLQALALLQTKGISAEALQDLLSDFLTRPQIFVSLAEELNIPAQKISEFKARFQLE